MTQFSSLYGSYLDEELGTDDDQQLFTTARRKAAINRGAKEFARLTKCLTRQSTVIITGGVSEYNLNSTLVIAAGDFMEFSKEQVQFRYTDASSNVTVIAGDDLPRRDVPWLNRYEPGWQISTTASTVMQLPTVYYERIDGGARYLGFFPKPSTGLGESAKAVVPYVAQAGTMVNDTSAPFTMDGLVREDLEPYHQAIVHYAASRLEKLRRDYEASAAQLQQFGALVAQYFQDTRRKGGNALTFGRAYFNRRNAATDRPQDPRT